MALVFSCAMLPVLAWYVVLRSRAPARLQAVGVYDQATADRVLPGSLRERTGPQSRGHG